MSILDLNPRAQESDKTKQKLINKHMQQTKLKIKNKGHPKLGDNKNVFIWRRGEMD